jgi:ribonuclease HII
MEAFAFDGVVVGCDEAGRGCLAGPVYAAAVILPSGFNHPDLNDSKLLSKTKRNQLRPIIEKEALAWAVGFMTPKEIDTHNILRASFLSMHRALDLLSVDFDLILVDGNRFIKYGDKSHSCIIKGDGKYLSIAAASVLAKTHRDEAMLTLHNIYPQYTWNKNKGYPTKAHRRAIIEHGVSPHHRQSFKLLPDPELF